MFIRKHPGNALRANSEFPGFVRLEIPKPWKTQEIRSPDSFQNCATPSTVGTLSCFGRGPLMEQPELVMKFLTVLGAPLTRVFLLARNSGNDKRPGSRGFKKVIRVR